MSGDKTAPSHAEGAPSQPPTAEFYLTDKELAGRLSWSPKTLEAKVRSGVFRHGVHYFQRPGMRRRWKWIAVVQWLEDGDEDVLATDTVPLASMTTRRAER